MKFTLLTNDKGKALYAGDNLVATWDKKEIKKAIESQISLRVKDADELVEVAYRNSNFPEKLPNQIKPEKEMQVKEAE